ncbi:MAG TPA: EAL domain-containing protein [Leptolyngbyaceae cyanobacterium M65_K2018_010]|nr:EAL domain-containing protein [Leptolyngbyaceae cyanobacterium M65_K2018_010]
MASLPLEHFVEPCPWLLPQASLQQAAQILQGQRSGCVLIGVKPGVLGILTHQALIRLVAVGVDVAQTPVSEGMLTDLPILNPRATVAEALQVMGRSPLRCLLVGEGREQVDGLLTRPRLRALFKDCLRGQGGARHGIKPDRVDRGIQIGGPDYSLGVVGPIPDPTQGMLRAAEARFQVIFEQVGVAICQADLQGRLVDVNPGMCQMLGYSPGELVGKTFHEITHPADVSLDLEYNERLLAGDLNAFSIEKRYLHKSGRSIWVALTVGLVRHSDGDPWFSIGIAQDIGDRKAAEMALRRSEERFALAIQDSKVGVWDWPAGTDGLYLSSNLVNLLGYDSSLNTMTAWLALIHPEDAPLVAADLARFRRGRGGQFEHTYRVRHRDGSLRWILSRGQSIGEGAKGQARLAGTHTDITEMKQTEAALQASHQHVSDILESITDAFFALDRHSQFTYLNQRAEQFLQRSRQMLLGRNFWYEFPEVLGTLFSQRFRQAMVERQSTTFEEYFARAKRWYEVHVYPTQNGLAVYLQDITSRRLTAQKFEHQIRREQALNRVIQAIRQSLDLDTIFETAAREIAYLLQVDHANIQRYCPQTQVWQEVAEYRTDPTMISLLNTLCMTAETNLSDRLKQLQIVQLDSSRDHHPLTQALPGNWLLVPLPLTDGLPWGCLGIHRPALEEEVWQPSDIELVKIVADQLVIAIQQAQTLDQAQRELQERQRAEARLKEAQRIAHTGNWELALPSHTLTWSEQMYRIYNLDGPTEPLSFEQQMALLEESDRPDWQSQLATALQDGSPINLEGTLRLPNGERKFVQLLGQAQHDAQGTLVALVGTLTDITERKQIEERLAYEALHDPLTGIPNRACFMEQLNAAAKRAQTDQAQAFAVLFIDLDRFKVINDSLGHLVGDQLLIECARRLSSVVRDGDLVARLGGDEFAILLNHIVSLEDPVKVANRIHEVLQTPLTLEGREIFISASVGVSSSLTGSVEAVDFLRDADTAMYQAKNNGRGRSALFDPKMYEQVATQLTLESDLQRALERGEIGLEYQPIVNLQNGALVGFEALVRWHHSQWGMVPPPRFIPLAEETGLILAIGEWTQRKACQQLSHWQKTLPQAGDLIMSVNLSVKQFSNQNLITKIDQALAEAHLSSHCLRLEITESALIENPDTAESLLLALKERGIQLCIDDFGTGYSSLSMVHRFPVQILKIDRSFTSRIEADRRGAAMVQAILALAHSLGMTAIAEGVETDAQVVQLRQFGCPFAQGYRFSKPLSAQAAEQVIRAWPWSRSALERLHHNEVQATRAIR